MAHKGRFRPANPNKYRGDPTNIVYRSSWEFKFMRWCDRHPHVLEWGSEEVIVPYKSPVDGKMHRYFPDFVIKKINRDKTVSTVMIEIKPKAQTMPPDPSKALTETGKKSRRYLNEAITYEVNQAKWEAATEFCSHKGWHFVVMTEDHLGIK